jgi:hypothetical protein
MINEAVINCHWVFQRVTAGGVFRKGNLGG